MLSVVPQWQQNCNRVHESAVTRAPLQHLQPMLQQIFPPSKLLIKEAFIKSQPYDKKGKQWNELTNTVTYCIAKDSLAINTVEHTRFKKMVKAFDSRYELPSRNYFSRTALPALYDST